MATTEMPITSLQGQRVLEIGPGAGGHSALFAKYGARVTSIDLTFERARSTQAKFSVMGNEYASDCSALQGDSEFLPFSDNYFDIVYSNGVLHHTNDTEKAIDEVFRVLKPGGQSVIMLYCKSSWHYWINLFLFQGILRGQIFNGPNWVGRVTEWGGSKPQTVANPITRCYGRPVLKRLFKKFTELSLRKGEFYFYLIPVVGRFYRKFQKRHYGTHNGGILVYGEPWPIQSNFELMLGRLIGFSWFISARKPDTVD